MSDIFGDYSLFGTSKKQRKPRKSISKKNEAKKDTRRSFNRTPIKTKTKKTKKPKSQDVFGFGELNHQKLNCFKHYLFFITVGTFIITVYK